MEKKEAEEILAKNKLVLDTAGLDNLPVLTVEINRYYLKEDSRRSEDVYLLGNLMDKENSNMKFVEADYRCESFFIKYGLNYWYRDFLEEALEVKDALFCLYGEVDRL